MIAWLTNIVTLLVIWFATTLTIISVFRRPQVLSFAHGAGVLAGIITNIAIVFALITACALADRFLGYPTWPALIGLID